MADDYPFVLRAKLGDAAFTLSQFRDNERVHLADPAKLIDALRLLKEQCGFDFLVDITAVDYLHYPDATDRYNVVYALADTVTARRVFVKVGLNDPDPTVASVVPLWEGANWLEREVYDMFGVQFEGHPDLRRILMPPEASAHPLRKDYPLRGRGERHNFVPVNRAES